jgi:Tol biopolymer transport system component
VYPGVPTAATQVYVIHPDGSGLLEVTDLAGGAASPSFSPDGSTIAFEEFNDDVRQPPTIDVVRTNGTGFLSLGFRTMGGGPPSWSPDGPTIAYTGSNGNIWGISPDATGAHALTNTGPANPQGECPIWSPTARSSR